MPRELYRITPVTEVTTESLNRLATELNTFLDEISRALATLEGIDGLKPKFLSDVDFDGNQLKNVGGIALAVRLNALRNTEDVSRGLEEISDPADAPASPTILRDDLVENVLPTISMNFDSLQGSIKEILTVIGK